MKSTAVDESLLTLQLMFCSREYQPTTRLNQQNEKHTSNCIIYSEPDLHHRIAYSAI